MKISALCLLLLSTAVLCQGPNSNPRYSKFINQHIKGNMSPQTCDSVINQRGITKTDSNECKETNTFIRATTGLVTPICGTAGEAYGELRKSLLSFDLVVCKLKGGVRRPHCQYRGKILTRRIAISCEGDLPVHYERDIVVFDE